MKSNYNNVSESKKFIIGDKSKFNIKNKGGKKIMIFNIPKDINVEIKVYNAITFFDIAFIVLFKFFSLF